MIEYPGMPRSSSSSMATIDPDTGSPSNILDASKSFGIRFQWDVPPPWNTVLEGSFRLRAYVESMGPGPEIQIGPTQLVPITYGQVSYTPPPLTVAANTLPGEGAVWGGVAVSGVYRIVGVLQHLTTGNVATEVCGFAEVSLRLLRTP